MKMILPCLTKLYAWFYPVPEEPATRPAIAPIRDNPIRPEDCPKFEQCSAPICPLDPDWEERTMLNGERVCFYLAESVKEGAEARIEAGLYSAVSDQREAICTRHPQIRRALAKAAKTGSRIASGLRLMQEVAHA